MQLGTYRYIGDDVGTDLERNNIYTFKKTSVDYIRAYNVDDESFEEITREEYQHYKEMGVLEEV